MKNEASQIHSCPSTIFPFSFFKCIFLPFFQFLFRDYTIPKNIFVTISLKKSLEIKKKDQGLYRKK